MGSIVLYMTKSKHSATFQNKPIESNHIKSTFHFVWQRRTKTLSKSFPFCHICEHHFACKYSHVRRWISLLLLSFFFLSSYDDYCTTQWFYGMKYLPIKMISNPLLFLLFRYTNTSESYSYSNRLCSSQRACVWLTERVQLIDFMCSLMLSANFWHRTTQTVTLSFLFFSWEKRHTVEREKKKLYISLWHKTVCFLAVFYLVWLNYVWLVL